MESRRWPIAGRRSEGQTIAFLWDDLFRGELDLAPILKRSWASASRAQLQSTTMRSLTRMATRSIACSVEAAGEYQS